MHLFQCTYDGYIHSQAIPSQSVSELLDDIIEVKDSRIWPWLL
jgi:hypothetical protein